MALAANVELYLAPDCPQAGAIRSALSTGMQNARMVPDWKEYGDHHPHIPRYLKTSGSFQLAIAGEPVVFPEQPDQWAEIISHKLQAASQKPGGRERRARWQHLVKLHSSFWISLFIAFFPKCPFCWAAYLSFLGVAGAGAIPYKPWFLPLAIVLLALNLGALYLSRKKRRQAPFWISLAGATIILLNRYYFQMTPLVFAGAALLLIAALYNALPQRMVTSLKFYVARIIAPILKPTKI
ncbi:hypothetical protein [Chitinophaga arvensicola]|uniref:Uncharacterized protein n=1 Tax=Chitinophaga arvensicola TaxID=29529 RepID=A0A1I0R319_9BACT|nr:hypothetical protein [Chitinophaga arvensicola]SEW34891.1 hypothetical protein SAMN04488122_2160 [Chitinophaga arvensicola]